MENGKILVRIAELYLPNANNYLVGSKGSCDVTIHVWGAKSFH